MNINFRGFSSKLTFYSNISLRSSPSLRSRFCGALELRVVDSGGPSRARRPLHRDRFAIEGILEGFVGQIVGLIGSHL
jgi:hypothetical protein